VSSDTPSDSRPRVRLCSVDELGPGQMRRFDPAGMDSVLVCNEGGTFYAVDDECTHAIASLAEGRLEGRTVFCPLHGGSFDICTGKAKSLPCRQALRTWPLAVVNGELWLLK